MDYLMFWLMTHIAEALVACALIALCVGLIVWGNHKAANSDD